MPARPVGPAHLGLGRAGEKAACDLLRSRGLRVIERNWTAGRLEIDLVCTQGDTLVFVEVKTRGEGRMAPGAASVGPQKRGKLVRAAAAYLSAKNAWDRPCRFDVVEVAAEADGRLRADHLENAFTLDDVPGAQRFWQPF
jgi:putative endonuclease